MISSFLPTQRTPCRLRSWATRHVRRLTAALCIVSALGNIALFFSPLPLPTSLLLLNLVTFGCIWLIRSRSNQTIRMQPQELASRMLEVQENERQRLSRELHDDIGQMLTAARMQLDWLQRRMPAELREQSGQLGETLEETLDKVRDLSAILNPRQLSSLGLEASLRSHLMRTLADSRVRWTLECHQRLNGISEQVSMAAFRITQEAVTNMLRHADARNLLVRLQRLPEGLALLVDDDGLGFSPATDPAREGQRGLAGMSERVALLGGTLTLISEPGHGTRIEVLFPWAPRNHDRAYFYKTAS